MQSAANVATAINLVVESISGSVVPLALFLMWSVTTGHVSADRWVLRKNEFYSKRCNNIGGRPNLLFTYVRSAGGWSTLCMHTRQWLVSFCHFFTLENPSAVIGLQWQPLLEIFTQPTPHCHSTHDHCNSGLTHLLTQQTNKHNNQTNNTVEVARTCDNVCVQKSRAHSM